MKILDADQVAQAVASIDVMNVLREAFVGLADGSCVQPQQTVAELPGAAGDAIYYPAVTGHGDSIGVTVSPFLAGLAEAGQPPVTAYTLLLSIENGLPTLLCDSMPLIAARTGATTALAVSRLATDAHRRLAIVGAGPIAESHARFATKARTWDSIAVHSRTIDDPASAARRKAMAAAAPGATFVTSLDEAASDADVVMLCTSSANPVLDPMTLRAGALVTSVSTDGPNAHEVPPAAIPSMDVYCDYRATTPHAAGEMVLAAERHGWSPDSVVADLPELLSGRKKPTGDPARVSFFRSIGLGIEDIALAALLAK
jgi:L-arginine dehydrogenase